MGDVSKITKEQFWETYNRHLPSNWIKFAYRYFSKGTEEKDMKLNSVITYLLLWLFVMGFGGTVIGFPRAVIGTITISYGIILAVLVLYLFSAVKLNNMRLNKIAKELGVTKQEYDGLAGKYYK